MTNARVAIGTARKAGRSFAVGFLVVLIVLLWSGLCAAQIPNPSFEDTEEALPWPRLLPSDWWHIDYPPDRPPSFYSYCTDLWSTDGDLSLAIFNLADQPVYAGDYQSFFVCVDLTDVDRIEFDVCLAADPDGPFDHFEASLLIDGEPLWSQDTGGVYLNQQVNVADLPGLHWIEIRSTALDDGVYDSEYWTLWDNLRLMQGSSLIPAQIDLNPTMLNPRSNGKWITCYIKLAEDYDASRIDGATVTLNDIPAVKDKRGWAAPLANGENVADYDADGVLERMVKFERATVQATIKGLGEVVTVKGRLIDETPFEGTAVLRLLDKEGKGK